MLSPTLITVALAAAMIGALAGVLGSFLVLRGQSLLGDVIAHASLPGVVAAHSTLPVIGVPVQAGALSGVDALLSMVQMPRGIPVATVAIGRGGAVNAALLAAAILGVSDDAIAAKLVSYREEWS